MLGLGMGLPSGWAAHMGSASTRNVAWPKDGEASTKIVGFLIFSSAVWYPKCENTTNPPSVWVTPPSGEVQLEAIFFCLHLGAWALLDHNNFYIGDQIPSAIKQRTLMEW